MQKESGDKDKGDGFWDWFPIFGLVVFILFLLIISIANWIDPNFRAIK
jgi:hypothetical protein